MPPEDVDIPDGMQDKAVALGEMLAASGLEDFRVGVGLKEANGEITDVLALRVYVRDKQPEAGVPPEQLVPTEFGGFPTDVVEYQPVPLADTKAYDPLIGGIEVSRPLQPPPSGLGAIGAVVRRRVDGRYLFLTCARSSCADQTPGNIHQPGEGRPGSTVMGTAVARDVPFDCAIVAPNGTRGVSPQIAQIGPVRGSAPPPRIFDVVKRGRTTELTSGLVLAFVNEAPGQPGIGSSCAYSARGRR